VTHPGQTFTVPQAAEVCQVSRKTITRRYDQLKLGGAYKDKAGQWAIPVAALLHAGLTPGRPAAPDTVPSAQASALGQQDTATRLRVAELEAQVTEYRHRAEVAEQLAAERSARVEDLRQALRMLEAGRPLPMPDPMPRRRHPYRPPDGGDDGGGPLIDLVRCGAPSGPSGHSMTG